jgi:hypothetical protein
MSNGRTRIAQITLIVTCSAIAALVRPTSAKDEESSILVKKPSAAVTEGPVLPPPSKPTKEIFPPQQTPQQPAKPVAKRPFMQPAEPREPARGQLTAESEPMPVPPGAPTVPPAPTISGPAVHAAPPIDYDTHHKARRMYRSGQVQLVMVTQNPADGCCYEIPLCVPACCTGDPVVSGGRGILGRGVVEYCWSCGFKAKVKFRHILGDVKVDYEVD